MNRTLSLIERAFELAQSGEYARPSDLALQLKREGYVDSEAQLFGKSIRRQLKALIASARRPAASEPQTGAESGA
jgi:hypothetical protein